MFLTRVIFFLVVEYLVPGFRVTSFMAAVGASIMYGMVSFFIRPLLKLISLPINLITFGLFDFVITAIIFMLTAKLSSGLYVESLSTAIFGAIVLSILQMILNKSQDKI